MDDHSVRRATRPIVSIGVPTYNRAGSYLRAALESACAQRYPALEILVGDNASTDDTPKLLQRFSDRRIRYLRHSVNIGANRNYNYLLQEARGDYFLLLHDDDVLDADFIEACMDAAGGRVHGGIIRTGVRVIDENGVTRRAAPDAGAGASLGEFYRAWFSGRTCWYLVNTLFNSRQLRAEGGFQSPHHLSEDGFAIARLARFGRIGVPGVKAGFRVHAGEKTIADPTAARLWGKEYLALLDCMCGWVEPDEVGAVRRDGRRFFARLAYNRAGLLPSRTARLRGYGEVLRLFEYRCWPTHRSRAWKLARRTGAQIRRAARSLGGRTAPAPDARAR